MALPDARTYFALALDPIHVGTGGYRLGRVDMTIVREPGTNLPKIPGTSLSGVTRACAAIATNRYRWTDGSGKERSCAGQGQGDGGHCGEPQCPVCVTFGFAKGQSGFQGLAQFSDARILFFPVYSMLGPVWVTSPAVLREHGVSVDEPEDKNKVRVAGGINGGSQSVPNRVNLGWLMLDVEGSVSLPQDKLQGVPDGVKQRVVLVSDKLFSHIVNDNLEVRTSVSIDPATGAADDGALFTYEALPRATVLWFSVAYKDPGLYRVPVEERTQNGRSNSDSEAPRRQLVKPDPREWNDDGPTEMTLTLVETVESGLKYLEHLGVGGMNTRGMGRLKVYGLPEVESRSSQPQEKAEAQR